MTPEEKTSREIHKHVRAIEAIRRVTSTPNDIITVSEAEDITFFMDNHEQEDFQQRMEIFELKNSLKFTRLFSFILIVIILLLIIVPLNSNAQTLTKEEGITTVVYKNVDYETVIKHFVNTNVKAKKESVLEVKGNNDELYTITFEAQRYTLFYYCKSTPNIQTTKLFESTAVKDIRMFLIDYILNE